MFGEELLKITEQINKICSRLEVVEARAAANLHRIEKIEEKDKQIQKLLNMIDKLKGKIAEQHETSHLCDELNDATIRMHLDTIDKLRGNIQHLTNERDHARNVKAMDVGLASYEHRLRLEEEITKLQEEVEQEKDEVQAIMREYNIIKEDNNALKAEIDQTNIEKSIIIDEQKKEIQVLKEALEKKEEMIMRIQQRQAELTRDYKSLLNGKDVKR